MCLHLPIKNESWEFMQIKQAYVKDTLYGYASR